MLQRMGRVSNPAFRSSGIFAREWDRESRKPRLCDIIEILINNLPSPVPLLSLTARCYC